MARGRQVNHHHHSTGGLRNELRSQFKVLAHNIRRYILYESQAWNLGDLTAKMLQKFMNHLNCFKQMSHCKLHLPKVTVCEFKALWKTKYIVFITLTKELADKSALCVKTWPNQAWKSKERICQTTKEISTNVSLTCLPIWTHCVWRKRVLTDLIFHFQLTTVIVFRP